MKTLLESLLSDFLYVLRLWSVKEIDPMPPEPPVIPPTTPPAPEPKYRWDTPEMVRHSVRVIGDEYGLTWAQKDLLCDICSCESAFKPNATLKNSPKSIDRGLFQINGYYHPEATPEKAYDPEWNTRWAIKNGILPKKCRVYWSASQKCWNKGGKYDSIIGG